MPLLYSPMNTTIHHILNDLKWDLGPAAAKCPCNKSDEATVRNVRKQTSESITSRLPILISPSGQTVPHLQHSPSEQLAFVARGREIRKLWSGRAVEQEDVAGRLFLAGDATTAVAEPSTLDQ
ncbi:hypothetical protein Nepgr_033289 [Nepenthes gracilis]|uniref:Uncharacterized protein n=1 Tax=Nepenthes gracilis TaxID=150966 RepID=A0AAD3TLT4_NEPGR|nr:hypothetical protein Nepgr_033289 [Nepenthes gracilis]